MKENIDQVSIFVAEDDEEYFQLMKETLADLKFQGRLEHFTNGEELLNFLHQERIGIDMNTGRVMIFLDLNMPKKDGHETLREIRASAALRKLPVVILTISTDPKEVSRCFEEGANSFITKPYDFEQLLSTFEVFQQYWFEKVKMPLS